MTTLAWVRCRDCKRFALWNVAVGQEEFEGVLTPGVMFNQLWKSRNSILRLLPDGGVAWGLDSLESLEGILREDDQAQEWLADWLHRVSERFDEKTLAGMRSGPTVFAYFLELRTTTAPFRPDLA
jgi:hypothetical protein